MAVNENHSTVPVSFRLDRVLIQRLREYCMADQWPPRPTQTDIVERGIKDVLDELQGRKLRRRA